MEFHKQLKIYIHQFILFVYEATKQFPKVELYGLVSQFRRAAVSIMLNYIEGFGRRKKVDCKVYQNFLETSYGSLKECKYIMFLSLELKYINRKQFDHGMELSENIGRMIWSMIK